MRNFLLRDLKQIALFFLVSSMAFLFIELSETVIEGNTASLDEKMVLGFRTAGDLSDPIGPKWVEEIMRDITALGGVGILVFITFVVLVYLLMERYQKTALLVFVSIATGMALSFSLKYGFTRPRPELVPHGSYVYTSSFPSGHAMMSSLVYLTIAGLLAQLPVRRRIKTYFFALAILLTVSIGISRVYLGVHWPTDVLAGWMVGSAWASLTYLVVRHLRHRHWFGLRENTEPVDTTGSASHGN